jgi:hypothetical protein
MIEEVWRLILHKLFWVAHGVIHFLVTNSVDNAGQGDGPRGIGRAFDSLKAVQVI